MTRSRRRKLLREAGKRRALIRTGLPVASALLATAPALHAQEQGAAGATTGGLAEVVVTAQKRSEVLQDVPISIEALTSERLAQLNISGMDDWVKYLSGVTTVKGLGQGGTGIGTSHVYMRGVVSGQDGNHSASQPTVGTYLDEQPVTTIDGTVDVHIYDIARIEVLAGPQGTLYGASSEAGTIRIITNKPDPTKFAAGYDLTGNTVQHGGQGWIAEGFVNIPLAPWAAVRLVAWDEHDAGYIHNVAGTNTNAGIIDGVREYPVGTAPPNTVSFGFPPVPGTGNSNVDTQNRQYNTASYWGGRAALAVNLGDNWTITPSFMGQETSSNGFFGYDQAMGDLNVARFGFPESYKDSWTQTALTVQGKVSNFDITYAGGWFVRNEHTLSDYSDYTYFYDKYFASGCQWVTEAGYQYIKPTGANPTAYGNCLGGTKYPNDSYFTAPQEYVITNGHYTKWSNELRVTTPQEYAVKALLGVFAQRQVHEIWEQYTIPGAGGNPFNYNPQGLAQSLNIPGVNGNTIWLTDEERVDRDSAAFGQVTWDISSAWQVIGGIRFYKYKNSLQGFYGYSQNFHDLTLFYPGMNICKPELGPAPFHGAPCTDLNETVSDNGKTYRGTLTYRFDPQRLMYFTYSTGFRPGGVNRVFSPAINSIFPPYKADTLTNWEIGWKTEWLDRHLRWNGALFLENWDNFQFLFLGPNSVTVVQNAASAQIKGIESNLEWAATNQLLISGSATYLHAVTTTDYCGPGSPPFANPNVSPGQNNYIPGTTNLTTNCPNQNLGYRLNSGSGFGNTTLNVGTGPEAPSGSSLPVAPKFKGNIVARYTFPLASWDGHVQAGFVYQSSAEPLLRIVDQVSLGKLPSYGLLDLAGGVARNGLSFELTLTNVTDKRAQLTRFVECTTTTCTQPYAIPTLPFTIGLRVAQRF